MERVLNAIANPHNQAILNLLQAEPGYARKIANLLDAKENEITRRLRLLEEVGLVASSWEYIGKNVKLYRLQAAGVSVRFEPQGTVVALEGIAEPDVVVASSKQRIPPIDQIAGRQAQLSALDDDGVHVVVGLPGIGKTTLLAAHAHRQQRPVFWHSFRGVESLAWLANRMAAFAHAQGDGRLLDAVRNDAEPGVLRDLMSESLESGYAFYFDDVQRIEDEHVQSFLDDAIRHARSRLYISSRKNLFGARGQPHVQERTLHGLDDEAVAELLARDGNETDPALVRRLRPLLGGHPLGLHLLSAAAHRTGLTMEEVVAGAGRMDDLHDYLLRELDTRLRDSQRRILTTASIFRGGFMLDDLRAVATGRIHAKAAMDLVQEHLLMDRGGTYEMHDLVRTFFGQMLDDPRPMHGKAARHFLDHGTTESRIEAMHHFIEAGRREDVLQLISENLDLRAYDFIDAGYARLYRDMLDLFTEDDVVDAEQWAVIEDEKGDVEFSQGDYETAIVHYKRARKHFVDGEEAADLGWKLASAYHRLGDFGAAEEWLAAARAGGAGPRTRDRLQRLAEQMLTA